MHGNQGKYQEFRTFQIGVNARIFFLAFGEFGKVPSLSMKKKAAKDFYSYHVCFFVC